jgi:hypothetical protein
MIGLSLPITAPVMAACTQLRLASVLVGDLRRPWHKRPEPDRCSAPTGSGWDFAVSARSWELPAGTAKSTRAGPGRLRGSKNRPQTRPPIYRKSDNKHTTHSRATKTRSLNYRLVRNGIGRKGDTAPQADPTRNA